MKGNKTCGCCEHFDTKDHYCIYKDGLYLTSKEPACECFADANEISEILREADTVQVVTEHVETEHDAVSHPAHYTSGGIECIDCIKAALGEHYIGFLIGNVIKYTYRYQHKNGVDDLKKAAVYLDWAIKELSNDEE